MFPKTGTGQARTTLTHQGPSPAGSKVLESTAESDPRPPAHGWVGVSDRNLPRPAPWGYAHCGEGPLFSEWLVITLAGKSESLGRKTLFGINKLPLYKAPNSNSLSLFSLYPNICFPSPFLFYPIPGLCISVSAYKQPISLFLTSSRLPTLDPLLSFGINCIIFCYSWQMTEPGKTECF